MRCARLFVFLTALLASAAAAGASGDYAQDLGTVYGGYQRLVALKEACDAAVPATRSRNASAYDAWRQKRRALIDELRDRVTAMIRLASADEREFARNLGRYEGAILREREAYRSTLLALDAADLRAQCEGLPQVLEGAGGDLEAIYAAELEVIRRRPLP